MATATRTRPCIDCGEPTDSIYGAHPACHAEFARAERVAQGLTPYIEDPQFYAEWSALLALPAAASRGASEQKPRPHLGDTAAPPSVAAATSPRARKRAS